ncbi:MAG: DsbA family protein [Candidatus Dasytiphilus stammeri]
MKKKFFIFLILLVLFSRKITCTFATPWINQNSYVTIVDQPVSGIPNIVEFFSFLCPHCYQLEYILHDKLKNKYHVSWLGGSLGKILTHAWSVAMVLEVEPSIIAPLFEELMKNNHFLSSQDVRRCFMKIGISKRDYDAVWNSFLVKCLIVKQEEAEKNIKITFVPTIIVNGQYILQKNIYNIQQYEKILKLLSQ